VLEKKLAAGEVQVTKGELRPRLEELKVSYRDNGWSSSAKPSEPVSAAARHLKKTADWTDDKQGVKIETDFWAEEPGSGYYFREEFDGDSLNDKQWESGNAALLLIQFSKMAFARSRVRSNSQNRSGRERHCFR